jgi:hypothetical protein
MGWRMSSRAHRRVLHQVGVRAYPTCSRKPRLALADADGRIRMRISRWQPACFRKAMSHLACLVFLAAQTGVAPLASNATCVTCHASGALTNGPGALSGDTYRGSLMFAAGEDPFFLAAWEIARHDDEEVAALCARCHFPGAAIMERRPEQHLPVDREGIACDLCHRFATPAPIDESDALSGVGLANARFEVGPPDVKVGPFDDALEVGHASARAPLMEDSRICGQCHDVTDEKRMRILEDGSISDMPTPLERTFSEWKQSAFSDPSSPQYRTCQGCHMPAWEGRVTTVTAAQTTRKVSSHRIVGSSVWAPLLIAEQARAPDAPQHLRGSAPFSEAASAEALRFLKEESVTLTAREVREIGGRRFLVVRVTNQTGHKIPTGYSEGRRMWIASAIVDDNERCHVRTGRFDVDTCDLDPDALPVETWEMLPAVDNEKTFHFALVDSIIRDSRIPPVGFVPNEDTRPVGKVFATLDDGTLAPYDDVLLPLDEAAPGAHPLAWPRIVDVRVLFQSTSRDFLSFLVDEAPVNGPALADLYVRALSPIGGGGPVEMVRLVVSVDENGAFTPTTNANTACADLPAQDPSRCLPERYWSTDDDPRDAGAPSRDDGPASIDTAQCTSTGTPQDAPFGALLAIWAMALVWARDDRRRR